MANVFDIVKLIETNPLTCLSNDYQSKLLNKIKEQFNNDEQQLFIASFYSYLNHNKYEFVIDLDDIWQWLGFSRIDHCKVVLEKNFEKEKDYKILLPQVREKSKGRPKETILMTINTFKELCIKANTQKAKMIRTYFIKLEEIIFEIINEEAKEFKELVNRQQLEIKNNQEIISKNELEQKINTQNILLESYHLKNIVYIIHIEDNLYKFGLTENIKERYNCHKKKMNKGIHLVYCIESNDNKVLEYKFKNWLSMNKFLAEKRDVGLDIYTELFEISDKDELIIKNKIYTGIEIIKQKLIEYNPKDNTQALDDAYNYIKQLKNKNKNINTEYKKKKN